MDPAIAALLGAGVGAVASTIGPVVVTAVTRQTRLRDEGRKELLETLTDFMDITSQRISYLHEGVDPRELRLGQNKLSMRLSLIVSKERAGIAGIAAEVCATQADSREAAARGASFIYTAGAWFRGEIPDHKIRSLYEQTLGRMRAMQREEDSAVDPDPSTPPA